MLTTRPPRPLVIFFDQVILSMVKLGIAFDLKSVIKCSNHMLSRTHLSLNWRKTKSESKSCLRNALQCKMIANGQITQFIR